MLCELGDKFDLVGRNARKDKARFAARSHFWAIELLYWYIGVKRASLLRCNKEGRFYLLIFVLSLMKHNIVVMYFDYYA